MLTLNSEIMFIRRMYFDILTILQLLVSATSSASQQLLREPLLKFFLEACFLFPRALCFDFCYDLDLFSQGQAVRAFSFGMGFSLMLSKVQGKF